MLTLQNFPTEYKLHDYQMYVRRLADSDSSYAEYSDFVKESTDFLAPLASGAIDRLRWRRVSPHSMC